MGQKCQRTIAVADRKNCMQSERCSRRQYEANAELNRKASDQLINQPIQLIMEI